MQIAGPKGVNTIFSGQWRKTGVMNSSEREKTKHTTTFSRECVALVEMMLWA